MQLVEIRMFYLKTGYLIVALHLKISYIQILTQSSTFKMRNQINQQAPATFSFRTIFYGVEALVDVVWNNYRSDILLNGEFVARLELEEERHTWFVTVGELNDYDLVTEIGSRIEARYY